MLLLFGFYFSFGLHCTNFLGSVCTDEVGMAALSIDRADAFQAAGRQPMRRCTDDSAFSIDADCVSHSCYDRHVCCGCWYDGGPHILFRMISLCYCCRS